MGFALVVGLGHNGRGEEHVTQGAALVLVNVCLCTVLPEQKTEKSIKINNISEKEQLKEVKITLKSGSKK